MIIFDADDPLVLDGSHDREGYHPGERARIAKARARQLQLDQEQERVMAKSIKKRASKIDQKLTAADKPKRGRPRNQDLPGMEDRAIKPLEDIAAAYAEVRDRRIALNQEEHDLKANALKLMAKYGKTIYRHDGISIMVIDGEPDVKVKVKKPGDETEQAKEALSDVEIEAGDDGSDEADATT